jgi:cytochrome c biogenesis protein CcmG, thiol:disulfide interchange protein DsbE
LIFRAGASNGNQPPFQGLMNRFRAHALLAACRQFVLLVVLACMGQTALAADDKLDLERFRGKVVLVDFWASWCTPCRQSFPWLNEMHAKYRDRGLVVIGINVDRERAEAERFLKQTPADFEIVYDPDGSLPARYKVPGMPSSYLFGRDGQPAGVHIGFRNGTREEREAELQWLLSSGGANALTRSTNKQKGDGS